MQDEPSNQGMPQFFHKMSVTVTAASSLGSFENKVRIFIKIQILALSVPSESLRCNLSSLNFRYLGGKMVIMYPNTGIPAFYS